MSRSRLHTPIFRHAGGSSEKDDKRRANRTLRHHVRRSLRVEDLLVEAWNEWGEPIVLVDDARPLPLLREVSNVWCFTKDGKSYRKPSERDRAYCPSNKVMLTYWRWRAGQAHEPFLVPNRSLRTAEELAAEIVADRARDVAIYRERMRK